MKITQGEWVDVMNCAKTVEQVMREYATVQSQRDLAQRRLPYVVKNGEGQPIIPYKAMNAEEKRNKPYVNKNEKAADMHVVLSNEDELNKAAEELKRKLKVAEEDERVSTLLNRLARRLIDGGFTKK